MSERSEPQLSKWRFSRQEVAGAFGDIGVFFPIALGLVLTNGLEAGAVFVSAGLLYILAGLYFGVVVPVQPMKLIGAYAIATGVSALQISTAAVWMGLMLLVLAVSNGAGLIEKLIPRPTIRGVQLTGGILLMGKGIALMLGTSALQQMRGAAEPFLSLSAIGPVPIGLVLGPTTVGFLSDYFQTSMAMPDTESLRWALVICSLVYLISFANYLLAARHLRKDLDRAAAG